MIPGNHLEDNTHMTPEAPGILKAISSPRLSPEEKLYVRVYLSTLSHAKAYEALKPGLSNYSQYNNSDNQFSRKDSVRFYISQGLQDKAEALTLSPDLILEKLWKEATREGAGSNHAARIQALTQLGKHLGLFEEKKETDTYTFNIVNYSSEPLSTESVTQLPSHPIEDEDPLPQIDFISYESSDTLK